MFQHVGDADALKDLRDKNPNASHCPWLRSSPNACESLPDGVEGAIDGEQIGPGMVCPHNVYYHKHTVFENRDGVLDTIDRIFRLLSAAKLGILDENGLDPLSVTELITAENEINRQQNEKQKREHERARLEAQSNQNSRKMQPSWNR